MMAHQPEPMDVDCMDTDFDNKENTFHNNVSYTEKGYEELDVSELNMRLRYSMTPASSPMSKSYTACPDNCYLETGEIPHYSTENANLTRSLNSTITKNENVIKSLRTLPLQSLRTEQFVDANGNASVLRQLDSTEDANVTVTISGTNDIDENVSLPSSSSSALHTPEATTPTKGIKEDASPIMRGLKSMLNMFRSSPSPIPPSEGDNITVKQEVCSPAEVSISQNEKSVAVASTPIPANKSKDSNTSKRSSPHKDSIIFKDDLEKELNWKDEKTASSPEKMAIHKLLFQNSKTPEGKIAEAELNSSNTENNFHSDKYMDVSIVQDKTLTQNQLSASHEVSFAVDSDNEFVDCETTFSKNESYVLDVKAIKEKMSPKSNLQESKHALCTTKNTEFVDCDSTFSKDDSYVLDIKEIQEKIISEPNLDETKHHMHVSFSIENTPTLEQSIDQNATNMTFSDLDIKLDMTVPYDYSDYSLATTNILLELEKLETNDDTNKQNVPSEIDTNELTVVHENIREQQVDTSEVITKIVTLDDTNLEAQKNETTESHENQQNITENNCNKLEIMLTEEQNAVSLVSVMDTVECTKCPNESEIVSPQSQELNPIQDNSYEVKAENPIHNSTADQIPETAINSNKTENENITDMEIISQESTETPIAISNNITEIVTSEIVPNVIKDDVKSLHILNAMENDTIPVEVNVIQNYVIPIEVVNSSYIDGVPSEVLSVTLNDAIPATVVIPPANLPLADEVIEHINILDDAQSKTKIITEIENPKNASDIPLPDDDFDKEDVANEVLTTSMNTALVSDSETVSSNLVHTLTENKSNNDLVLPQTSESQVSELPSSENTDAKISVVQSPETLSETEINSKEAVLPEPDSLTLPDSLILPLETTDSTASEIVDKKILDTVPEHEIGDNSMLSEVGPSSNTNQTNDIIAGNVNEIIDDSHIVADFNKYTVTTDIVANVQSLSEIEPMDITLNESLNLTRELPDLVNQTIVLAKENGQNPIIANEPKQVELAPDSSDGKNMEHIVTLKNVSENIDHDSDLGADSRTILAESISANESLIVPEANMFLNDVKQPASGTEIGQVENVAINLSDDQPPTVFTNIPDSVPMDVEGTTVDEEIIVSANNSPYVSLMSGVETVLEKNPDPEKIEDTFEEIENPFISETTTNVPSSPPITSKGYNFNFDEIDDPFATKMKIRLSPPLDTLTKPTKIENDNDKQFKVPSKEVVNRRKSQPPERKKPLALKKKCNTSFDAKSTHKTFTPKADETVTMGDTKNKTHTGATLENKQVLETNEIVKIFSTTQTQEENLNKSKDKKELLQNYETEPKIASMSENPLQENKSSIDSIHAVSSELKTTSSSEQSAYYSAGASSTESFHSKNVFNLPEIDDMNFNPFATKSKMRQSPPPDAEIDNPFATRSKMRQSPTPDTVIDKPIATRSKIRSSPDVSIIDHGQLDGNRTVTLDEAKLAQLVKNIEDEGKMETELMEKDTSSNITDTTSSSRTTDNQNLTTREVHTEDEDTIEGPFLEAGDDIDKFTDFATDKDDMMQFNDLQEAARANEDNLDGEIFIDAEAYEFLLNQNKSNVVADSGKESLFLKFDPLFAQRMSYDGVLASLNKTQKKQSTPTKPTRPSLRIEASPIAGPSTLNVMFERDINVSQESNDDANITVTKPTMVVTPALNPVVTPRTKSITPARPNRRSITFTSPAIAVIDRLLSMSANNSILGHDSVSQSNGEQTEADLALTQLRELLAEKEISVYNLRSESKELKDRLSTMESQVRILESDGQERLKKINELHERLAEKTKINKNMAAVVEEYERTIASLIADIEQDKKRNAEEKIRLIEERDEQTAHLTSMEVSFSDLHSKYEKSKQVILTCKANEDICKKTIQDFEEQVTKMQTNYEMLKQHATAKLNHANQELEKINRSHEAEVVKLNAMIKRNHLLATSLQETLMQKTKANDELTAICDELINKVGSNK